ncbi:MAG: sulfatase, partial [Planctomycetota bacterium]
MRPATHRPPSRPRAFAWVLLGLCSCSRSAPPAAPIYGTRPDGSFAEDLLRRLPDRAFAAPGTPPVTDVGSLWPAAGDQATLPPGAAVEFWLEIPTETRVEGRAETDGDGVLLIGTGGSRSGTDWTHERLDVIAGAESFSIAVPAIEGGPTRLRLEWLTEAGAPPVRLTRLERVEPDAAPRPPIVFLSIDTLAAQNMSLYGYERPTTPELAAFARECVVFERALANAPWTIPSYASQLSGQLSQAHHVGQAGGPKAWDRYVVTPNRWTLPEAVRALGYETAAIYDNSWLGMVSGMLQGFDHVDGEASERPIADLEGGMRTVFPRATDWLAAREEGPFFLFAQILDAHGPYLPSRAYRGRFGSDRRDGERRPVVPNQPPVFGGVPENMTQTLGMEGAEAVPIAPLRAAYDEKLVEVDAEIGRFLEGLRRHPRWDEMLVVISADHGESMELDEFYFRHGALSDATLHVPLLVRLPKAAGAGTRVETSVELLGLYPTLLELLGLSSERPELHGRSFAGALSGAAPDPAPTTAYGSYMRARAAELDGYKLVRHFPVPSRTATLLTHPPTLALLLAEFDGLAERIGVPLDPTAALRILARP